MENNHCVIEDLSSFAQLADAGPVTSYFGVYDGHGGYLISEYLASHLATNIAKQHAFMSDVKEAMRIGFMETDKDVLAKISRDVCLICAGVDGSV
jgi:protein phosphatase 2C family protein 2/3